MIDKRSTLQYFLEPSPNNKKFGILRLHAGPPYEDIVFKIVNREWEFLHQLGFCCQFTNGIFQLWIHFKQYRYRGLTLKFEDIWTNGYVITYVESTFTL